MQRGSEIFEKFVESLDRGRAYFTQKDIEEFEEYRYELDDLLKRGDLKPAFSIFNRYQASLIDRLNFLLKEIDKGIENIDFGLPDSIRIDRDELPWPADDKERDMVWQKRLKAAALSLRLNDKTDQEISEQRSELKEFGFSSAQILAHMSIHSMLVPPRIKLQESLVCRSIRIARSADLHELVRHYELVHKIPRDYAFQVATAHLVTYPKNVCCTWVAVSQCEILASITAYRFGRQGLVSWLATCPMARKQGIGSRLLVNAINYLKDRGVSGIELQSVPEAAPFYQKIGFTKEYDVELWIYPGVT